MRRKPEFTKQREAGSWDMIYRLSKKAAHIYMNTSPIEIYKIEHENGEATYCARGAIAFDHWTLKEIEAAFETMYDENFQMEYEPIAEEIFEKHKECVEVESGEWKEGSVKDFWKDREGNLCIQYESGSWWHYKDIDSEIPTFWQGQTFRLFVDMDGTLAEFKPVDTLETLYEEGYFRSLKPQENVVEAVRSLHKEKNGIEVYILSSVLSDSPYALKEKNAWLDQYLPELDTEHRIFPACGQDKKDYIPGTPGKTDFLLDDYTKNLQLWDPPCVGIKLLNGINNTHGTWKGKKVDRNQRPDILAEQIQMQMEKAESRKIVKQAYQRGR